MSSRKEIKQSSSGISFGDPFYVIWLEYWIINHTFVVDWSYLILVKYMYLMVICKSYIYSALY